MSQPAAFWLAEALCGVAFAGALAWAVAAATDGGRMLAWALVTLAAAAMLRALVQVRAIHTGQRNAARIKTALRDRVYIPVITARAGERRMLGEQLADAVDRVEDLDGYHARFLPLRSAAIGGPLLIAAAAAVASPVAAAILLATLLPFGFGMALAGTAAGHAAGRQFAALARLSGLFVDRLRALPVILSFAAEDRITRHLTAATQDVARRTLSVLRIAFLSGAVIEFFAALSVALVAVYCGFNLLGLLPFAVGEQLDLPRALFVLALAPEFYLPMRRLAAAYHDKQIGEAATARLAALAPERPVSPESASPPVIKSAPALRFSGVIIDHGETRVGPVSFSVAPGAMTVITGPTGSGKSSLLHLLLGLAPLSAGEIDLNGRILAAARLAGQVGWAGQATALMPGTLAHNIGLARPDASRRDIERAARRVGLGPLIDSRPRGLDLGIDHRGSGLSGGERRRIGLARVLLKDAPLWLLDEPTADLDLASAHEIHALLRDAGQGRTLLVATHSPELIALAQARIDLP